MSFKKIRKFLHIICAFALAVVMGVEGPAQVIAFALEPDYYFKTTPIEQLESEIKSGKINGQFPTGTKVYISELMIGTGDSAEEAKKALHDAGYLVYDRNMNEGTDTGKYSYLGYKLTTDRSDAVTDLRVMDERGGYEQFDYLDVAGKQFPELAVLLSNMRYACKELKQMAEEGDPSAVSAMEYLNLFTVTYKESEEKEQYATENMEYITGDIRSEEPVITQKLGEYLITDIDKRSDKALKIIELCTNAQMLYIINSQIAMGLNKTELIPTVCDLGEKEPGVINGTYTSVNGVAGYTELENDPDWIKNAVGKMLEDNNLSSINDKQSKYWAEMQANNGTQSDLFDCAVKNNTLSEAAEKYLKSIVLEDDNATLAKICGIDSSVNAYQFLTKAPQRYRYAFYNYLPEVCKKYYFVDVLEICASDHLNRIPKELVIKQNYENNIIGSMVSSVRENIKLLDSESARKQKADDIANYRSDINRFALSLVEFFDAYTEAKKDYDANGEVIVDPEDEKTDSNGNTRPNDLYYLRAYDLLAAHEIRNGLNLAEYLQKAYTEFKINNNSSYAFALLYPIVSSFTKGQVYTYKTLGLVNMLLNTSIAENEVSDCKNAIPNVTLELKEGFGSDVFSVWVGGNKRLVAADEKVFFTDDKARLAAERSNFKNIFKNETPLSEKIENAYYAVAGVAIGSFGVAAVAGGIALSLVLTSTATAALGMTTIAAAAIVLSIVAAAAIVAVIVLGLVCLALFIAYLFASKEKVPDEYTVMPTILIDCVSRETLDASELVEYDLVRNQYGTYADINCFKGYRWTALYYSKNEAAGSPLTMGTVKGFLNQDQNSFFTYSIGNDNGPDTAYPLCKFGQTVAFNLNSNCVEDDCNGLYFYFFSEDSLEKKPRTTAKGKYISGLRVAYAERTPSGIEGAKSSIEMLKGYYLIDVDLSPNSSFCTYLGYSTTNVQSEALTDIRVSYGAISRDIHYGDITYTNITPAVGDTYYCPAKTCEPQLSRKKDTKFSYAIYATTNPGAGSPILSQGFGVKNEISEIPDGCETIQVFSGGHFNFNAWDGEGYENFDKHKFVYFTPETQYRSTDENAKLYVSGFAFYSGSENWLSASDTKEYNLAKFAELSAGGYVISKYNLTPSLLNDPQDVTYLAYYLTYNPKRAITEIGSFTGEAKCGYLANNLVSAGVGYEACQVYTQGDYHYYDSGSRQRLVRASHAYFTILSKEVNDYNWPKKTFVYPRGLYVAGPQEGVDPLTVYDILFTDSTALSAIPGEGSTTSMYRIAGKNNVGADNKIFGKGWKSVHALDNYYYDSYNAKGYLVSRYNLGLGMNPTSDNSGNGNLFIYYRNGTPDRIRGNYVSKVDIIGSVAANASLDIARCNAMSSHTEIMNSDNPMSLTVTADTTVPKENPMLFNKGNTSFTAKECPTQYNHKKEEFTAYPDGFYFIAVSYTNAETGSIGYLRMLKQDKNNALDDSVSLPLSPGSVKTDFTKGMFAELPYYTEKSDDTQTHDKAVIPPGYALYSSANGWAINRIEIKELALAPMASDKTYWGENRTGDAEYFVPFGSGYEPFVFENRVANIGYCIAIKRSETAKSDINPNGGNPKKYIQSINVIKDVSYDGTVHKAAASLGARNYPFVVDWDISDGRIEGSNQIVALAVTRTSDITQAIKDIRISSVDLGEKVEFNNFVYVRQNDISATDGIPNTEDVFIYATCAKPESGLIDWNDVDYENTDWETFDWYHLDFTTAWGTDSWDVIYQTEISYDILEKITRYKTAQEKQSLKTESDWYAWANRYAITNLGFMPDPDSALQNERIESGTARKYYWAGACADYDTVLLTPVTAGSAVFTASTFDGSVPALSLVYTNGTKNAMMTMDEEKLSFQASVFTENPKLVMILVLFAISVLAVIGVIIYKKRRSVLSKSFKEENN